MNVLLEHLSTTWQTSFVHGQEELIMVHRLLKSPGLEKNQQMLIIISHIL